MMGKGEFPDFAGRAVYFARACYRFAGARGALLEGPLFSQYGVKARPGRPGRGGLNVTSGGFEAVKQISLEV